LARARTAVQKKPKRDFTIVRQILYAFCIQLENVGAALFWILKL